MRVLWWRTKFFAKPCQNGRVLRILIRITFYRWEKRGAALKEENVHLRKIEHSYKDLEEQIAKLRKKNSELNQVNKVIERGSGF